MVTALKNVTSQKNEVVCFFLFFRKRGQHPSILFGKGGEGGLSPPRKHTLINSFLKKKHEATLQRSKSPPKGTMEEERRKVERETGVGKQVKWGRVGGKKTNLMDVATLFII